METAPPGGAVIINESIQALQRAFSDSIDNIPQKEWFVK